MIAVAMKSDQTMLVLANTFLELADTLPLEKITISGIVERCGRNRKTFYYYFMDIDSLIVWIFRRDLARLLEEGFERGQLVFEERAAGLERTPSAMERFPYYVRVKSGVRTLDHTRFFALLARTFDDRREFYRRVFKLRNPSPNNLRSYLYALYRPALQGDIEFMLGNRYLQPAIVERLAEFYTGAFVNDLVCRTKDATSGSVEAAIAPLGNFIHNALSREVEEQRLRRKL